ncbi:hypothetical protein Tco_0198816 [Tanacetum coccineum]
MNMSITLKKRKSKAKKAPKVRKQQSKLEKEGTSSGFRQKNQYVVVESKVKKYPIHDNGHSLEDAKPKVVKKFVDTEQLKEVFDRYMLLENGFSLWFLQKFTNNAASNATYPRMFNKIIKKIKRANSKVYEYLLKKEPKTWSRAYFHIGFEHVIPTGGDLFEVRNGSEAYGVDEQRRTSRPRGMFNFIRPRPKSERILKRQLGKNVNGIGSSSSKSLDLD